MNPKVILSVEDNPANRKLVRDLFGKHHYRVIEAASGEEALERVAQEMPDLILMDIQLPRISGYDVARTIKANPKLKHIPIIAVTSFALSGDDQKAYAAGCDDYIAKPFRPRVLLEKVQRFLG